KVILLVLLFCGSISCVYTEKANGEFLRLLKRTQPLANSRLKMDGAYHFIEKELLNHPTAYKNGVPTKYVDTPYLDCPVFFFDNGLILYYLAFSLDSAQFIFWQQHYSTIKGGANAWGVYDIRNDTITAIVYIAYTGKNFKRRQSRQCYFQGILKNRDTITAWRMIPPFPEIAVSFDMNKELLEYLKAPKDLSYKPVPGKIVINPAKAWINELKK
ncbi:MAG TPA: hypothetical protein VM012_12350, partial [Flavitalea sp.]|nr:hypothetical protein [Flavitalea sp.]